MAALRWLLFFGILDLDFFFFFSGNSTDWTLTSPEQKFDKEFQLVQYHFIRLEKFVFFSEKSAALVRVSVELD